MYRGFNDAGNVEWIPAQEYRYEVLEKVLYTFLGGSYEPGSIGCPFSEFLKYSCFLESQNTPTREYLDFYGQFDFFNKPAKQGDVLKAYIDDFYAGEYVVTEPGIYDIRIYGDDPQTPYKDGAVPGDYISFEATSVNTGITYPVETSLNVPVWTNQVDRIMVDINAVPEPSSIVLFGFMAFGYLIKKNR